MGKNINFFKKVASLVLAGLTIFSSVTTSKAFEEKSTPNSIQIKNNKSVLQNIKALKTKNLSLSQKVGMGLGIGGLGILSVAGIYYAIDSFMNEPNEALPSVQQETSLNTFVENKTIQRSYIENKLTKLGYNLLNIAIVGKDKDLSQKVINRLCEFAQKADGYDDIFLVRSRSGRHFGIKFYNIAESGLEAISECHYAFCPFNLVNPNLENTITELDNLKELIKSKNYLCDITFIPICNSIMSEEENRACIETINQYAVSCEKEHRWDGIQDFNSVYLGKDEEKLIPALLENIAEWGNIRIKDFRSKFGKSPTVLRQPNFSKGFCSETEPKAKVYKETKVNSVKDIQPKPDSISLSFDDIFDDELKKIFITQIQQAVNSEYTVESIKTLLGNFKFKNGIRGGRFEFAEYLKKSKLKSNK